MLSLIRLFRSIRHPLPYPEREADKFFSVPLHRLFFDQIQELIRFTLDEVRKSRAFGLYIEKEHLEKEELFFLAGIDAMGGVINMRKTLTFEEAHEFITSVMWKHFDPELRYYYKLSKKRRETVLNKYNCHLESVRNRLLHEIYNVPNTKLFTAP